MVQSTESMQSPGFVKALLWVTYVIAVKRLWLAPIATEPPIWVHMYVAIS